MKGNNKQPEEIQAELFDERVIDRLKFHTSFQHTKQQVGQQSSDLQFSASILTLEFTFIAIRKGNARDKMLTSWLTQAERILFIKRAKSSSVKLNVNVTGLLRGFISPVWLLINLI